MSETQSSDLAVATTETSTVVRTLEVEVDVKRVRKAFDRAYRDLSRSVRVKGFRPGKAPRAVLEKLYGGSLAEEIQQRLVSETLPEAVQESGVHPVSEPSVDSEAPKPDAAFRYTVAIEVKPPIALPELRGLPARRPTVAVEEEEVDGELEALRERRAPLVDLEKGETATAGTRVCMDYLGRIDGETFEGGSAEGANVELGSGRLIPGFEEQLLGVAASEERLVEVAFPEDYPAAELAGKQAVFEVKVTGLQGRQLPELDDAFAKEVDEALEGLDALRQRLRDELTARRERAAKEETRRTLMDALIERTDFAVPPGLLERRLGQQLQMAHQQLESAMPREELHERLSQWREEWRPQAEREVRETLLLEAVADAQELDVGDADVDAHLAKLAGEQGMAEERLRKAWEERGMLASLRAQLRQEKALEFLLAEAKVEEVAGS